MSTTSLLRKAATALDDGIDPFAGSFLKTNDVSMDECFTMAEMLALGARIVAKGLDNPGTTLGMEVLMAMAEGA